MIIMLHMYICILITIGLSIKARVKARVKTNVFSYWNVAANGPACSRWALMLGCWLFLADQREVGIRRHGLWRRAFLSMQMHWHGACSSYVNDDILCQPLRYCLLCCSVESMLMFISAHPPFCYVKICKKSMWED